MILAANHQVIDELEEEKEVLERKVLEISEYNLVCTFSDVRRYWCVHNSTIHCTPSNNS